MSGNVLSKFEKLVRRLNYNKIKLVDISIHKIQDWCYIHLPDIVSQLETLNWDLSREETWTETVFINFCLKWYDKNVALYITTSLIDFNLANKVIKTKKFFKFRKALNIDAQCIVLVDPTIFLEMEDLDTIYIALDFNKGYSGIDLSHYDEEDNLENELKEKWGWLEHEEDVWKDTQSMQAYSKKIQIL